MKELLEKLEEAKEVAEEVQNIFDNSDLTDDKELTEYIEKIYWFAELCLEYIKEQ